eukprot:TRINITY_DN3335_c0_g1_i10.p1 TRINITY_DN3335_c0_g1~~TRINITY_DN3335_c0_g1_i10.p1  ORF type:complete len:717 (+),score=74.66 TRINITY_DN3335_c0_g1_i10:92-2152(+)
MATAQNALGETAPPLVVALRRHLLSRDMDGAPHPVRPPREAPICSGPQQRYRHSCSRSSRSHSGGRCGAADRLKQPEGPSAGAGAAGSDGSVGSPPAQGLRSRPAASKPGRLPVGAPAAVPVISPQRARRQRAGPRSATSRRRRGPPDCSGTRLKCMKGIKDIMDTITRIALHLQSLPPDYSSDEGVPGGHAQPLHHRARSASGRPTAPRSARQAQTRVPVPHVCQALSLRPGLRGRVHCRACRGEFARSLSRTPRPRPSGRPPGGLLPGRTGRGQAAAAPAGPQCAAPGAAACAAAEGLDDTANASSATAQPAALRAPPHASACSAASGQSGAQQTRGGGGVSPQTSADSQHTSDRVGVSGVRPARAAAEGRRSGPAPAPGGALQVQRDAGSAAAAEAAAATAECSAQRSLEQPQSGSRGGSSGAAARGAQQQHALWQGHLQAPGQWGWMQPPYPAAGLWGPPLPYSPAERNGQPAALQPGMAQWAPHATWPPPAVGGMGWHPRMQPPREPGAPPYHPQDCDEADSCEETELDDSESASGSTGHRSPGGFVGQGAGHGPGMVPGIHLYPIPAMPQCAFPYGPPNDSYLVPVGRDRGPLPEHWRSRDGRSRRDRRRRHTDEGQTEGTLTLAHLDHLRHELGPAAPRNRVDEWQQNAEFPSQSGTPPVPPVPSSQAPPTPCTLTGRP